MSDEKKPQEDAFEQLYLKERKKAAGFMVATVILAVLATGLGVYALSGKAPTSMAGQGGMMHFGEGKGAQLTIKNFFKSDGSIDQDKVNEVKSRMPEGEDRFSELMRTRIDTAIKDNDISSQQGTDLKNALGISES